MERTRLPKGIRTTSSQAAHPARPPVSASLRRTSCSQRTGRTWAGNPCEAVQSLPASESQANYHHSRPSVSICTGAAMPSATAALRTGDCTHYCHRHCHHSCHHRYHRSYHRSCHRCCHRSSHHLRRSCCYLHLHHSHRRSCCCQQRTLLRQHDWLLRNEIPGTPLWAGACP